MLPASVTRGPERDRERLREAARGLESLVLKQLVTASKAFGGGDSAGAGLRADLFASTLADALVKGGGIGLAAQLERTLDPGLPPGGAPGSHPAPELQRGAAPTDPARALRGYTGTAASRARGLKGTAVRADDEVEAGS